MLTITEELLDEHTDKMVDILENIKLNKVSILAGENGCGKSFIRKQLPFAFKRRLKLSDEEMKHIVQSVSMQRRTESNVSWGALSDIMHDSPSEPTSYSTYHMVDGLFNTISTDNAEKHYFIIDEPEIGMSEESQCSLANILKDTIPYILENSYGLLLITHSRIFVEVFKDIADFHYLGLNTIDMTAYEWLNREIKPTDFTFLEKWSLKLFRHLNKRMGLN